MELHWFPTNWKTLPFMQTLVGIPTNPVQNISTPIPNRAVGPTRVEWEWRLRVCFTWGKWWGPRAQDSSGCWEVKMNKWAASSITWRQNHSLSFRCFRKKVPSAKIDVWATPHPWFQCWLLIWLPVSTNVFMGLFCARASTPTSLPKATLKLGARGFSYLLSTRMGLFYENTGSLSLLLHSYIPFHLEDISL